MLLHLTATATVATTTSTSTSESPFSCWKWHNIITGCHSATLRATPTVTATATAASHLCLYHTHLSQTFTAPGPETGITRRPSHGRHKVSQWNVKTFRVTFVFLCFFSSLCCFCLLRQLQNAAKRPSAHFIHTLCVFTGGRRGDLCQRWEDDSSAFLANS